MATNYHLQNIRTLLTEGFSEAELRAFCFDTPEFRPAHHELADLSGKAAIVSKLLEFAVRRDLLTLLLAWAKQQNPTQYTNHQSYELSAPSPIPSPSESIPHPRPLRVFLCHAAADKPAVRDLYQRLRSEGFIQPWLDEEELLPGQDWQLEIPKAVRTSDVVLVCLSSHSINKAGYVQKEIKFALDIADEQPEGTIFLIPLRLEACEVPERLRRWHWASLYDTRGYDRLLRSLQLQAKALGIDVTLGLQVEEALTNPTMPESSHLTGARDPNEPYSFAPPQAAKFSANWGAPIITPAQSNLLTITHPIHLELVCIPAGEFLMGSDPAKDKSSQPQEQPQHRVYISEFLFWRPQLPW